MDPSEVGRGAALFAAVAVVNYLTGLGLPQGLLRYSGHFRTPVSALVNVAIVLTAATSVLGAGIFAAGVPLWAPQLESNLSSAAEVGLFMLFCAGVSVGLVLDSVLAARRRGQWAFVRSALMSMGKLVALPMLAFAGAMGVYIALCGPIVAASVAILVLLPIILPTYRRNGFSASGPVREFLDFSLRAFPSNIVAGAPLLLPLVVLGLLGTQQTAFFSVAWSFAVMLQIMPSLIAQVSLSETAWQDPWITAARAKRFALALVIPAIVVLAVGAPLILTFYGAEYADNATLALRVFALAVIPWALFTINTSLMRAQDRHLEVLLSSGALGCAALLGAIVGGITNGLAGLAIGWLAGSFVVSLAIEFRSRFIKNGRGAARPDTGPAQALGVSELDEHQLVFVGGLHHSGSEPLTHWLGQQPNVSKFKQTDPGDDEGQHLQSVYATDSYYGGPGRFAFAPEANLTEFSSLITPETRSELSRSWQGHWDLDKRFLVEKSPPNLVQTRFLQAVFPGCIFVIVIRHPIAVSEATYRWGHRLVRLVTPPGLIRHWVHAYETLLSDAAQLDNVILVRYEDLVQASAETLERLGTFVGLDQGDRPIDIRIGDSNPFYFKAWPGERGQDRWPPRLMARWIARRYERRVRVFGYSLQDPDETFEPDERVTTLLQGRCLDANSRSTADRT